MPFLELKFKNLYVVEFSKMRKPEVKITNISKDDKKEEIQECILQHKVVNGKIKITYTKSNRNGQKR